MCLLFSDFKSLPATRLGKLKDSRDTAAAAAAAVTAGASDREGRFAAVGLSLLRAAYCPWHNCHCGAWNKYS
jgi:hypothetical protein